MKNLKYFYGSFFIAILGLLIAVSIYPDSAIKIIYSVLILAILEISLSFDNAIINAKILGQMPIKWQKIFILIGLPIAVFGMRLIFPILLVSITSNISFLDVLILALNTPQKYQIILESSMPYISSFGGSFLLMVFFNFFLNASKENHWISFIENNFIIKKIRNYNGVHIFFVAIFGVITIYYANQEYQGGLSIAFLLGIIVYEVINILNYKFGNNKVNATDIARNGLIGFIYLEIIDASFSFDGVIGAFAISTNIIIIMIGLGIGAMFVRSLTIFFVKKRTLTKYIYLEHGAHYAIGFLAIILLGKIFIHIPEWFSGSIGIILLILAFIQSIIVNKKSSN